MPYLQSTTLRIFGFQPAMGPQGRVNPYPVSSSEATQVLAGDVCIFTSIMTVKAAVSASLTQYAGVAAESMSTALYATATPNLLLYDDLDQIFAGAVTTSAGMGSTMVYGAFGIITTATGLGVPSTAVLRSKMALGIAASSAGVFRSIGLHPVAGAGLALTSGAGTPQIFLVRPNATAITVALTT